MIDAPTQEALHEKAGHLEELVQEVASDSALGARASSDDASGMTVSYPTVEDAVLDLVNTLPEGTHDREAVQLFRCLTELRRAMAGPGSSDRAELAAMRLADVVRRLERRIGEDSLDVPEEAFRFVARTLDRLDSADVAKLLGVSTRTLSTWRGGGAVQQNKDRVRLVAQLVARLRSSMTQTGLMMWFEDPADALDGFAPLDLLRARNRSSWARLMAYARGGSGQLAG